MEKSQSTLVTAAAVDVGSGPLLAAISKRCGSTMLRDICLAATEEERAQLNWEIANAPTVEDTVGFFREQERVRAWRDKVLFG